MKQIDLSNVHACQSEMQDCSRGLAYLDHLFGQIVDSLAAAQDEYDTIEAAISAGVRQGDDSKALTATEIKGRITAAFEESPAYREVRVKLTEARGRKTKIDRWMRSIEKRLGAAQSASNGHDQIGRYGGGENT